MPAMEAAGSGTTFIIPRGQGVCSLFVDGEDGFYTKEKDTETILKLLRQLMENKELATRIGNKAWEKAKNNYSWEKHAQELRLLIDKTFL
jgi:glycosyltransferase involved in cell wall biosynthesis